ncbi:putative membrane protein [Caldisphaera lagunensis DSM 15908]|uniref:Putative membrane protein n=1 Tax=Caldisphaera lagunensis (strain DSM 15908 / JCM 11604 / ANMR 0165 / IC-154) TaxID=1056495 RepID=L0ACW8_CALLD|nr:lysine exporter LysO family protein [Caldisphaera lagunensis]AFZ71274.1 putative membrane protein [Caldisphaera lagunensis DSM 15908]
MENRFKEFLPPLGVFTSGLLLGIFVKFPIYDVETIAVYWLYILLGIIGIVIGVSFRDLLRTAIKGIRNGILLTLSVIIGDIIAGFLISLILRQGLNYSLSISLGSGWYSLIGPFVSFYNPYFGVIGFVSNLLREAYTLSLFPLIYSFFGTPSIAMGGATTMDTTLGVIIKYSGIENSSSAILQGLIITIILPFILPFTIILH